MGSEIDDQYLELECPKCGHKFEKTLGWLDRNRKFKCPTNCGGTFEYSGSEISDIRKRLEQLGKDIDSISFDL